MRSDRGRLAAAVLLVLAGAACDGGGNGVSGAGECGVPTPDPAARPEVIPRTFLLDGEATVTSAGSRPGGVTGVLSIETSVGDAVPLYRKAARRGGFDVVGAENEGFEAEVYVKRGKLLGAIQIRRSLCDDVSVVFVNLVKGNVALPIVTTPSPSPQ